MSLQFQFPEELTTETFIASLSHEINLGLARKEHARKTYYDSFDWRLFSSHMICEFNRSTSATSLNLINVKTAEPIADDTTLSEVPRFCKQFKPGEFRNLLQPLLEMRALLAICTIDYQHSVLNIINTDEKTVARLHIEEYQQLNNRASLEPIKGYSKAYKQIAEMLTAKLELIPTDQPILLAALALQGRQVKVYSSKLKVNLQADMRADIACKILYRHLLKAIKANQQGTIADTDSEFLHDFRVAVRRTRAALSQLKAVFPPHITSHYAEFFSWLGKMTGPTRDLDVYLLNFDQYKNCLPVAIREDLNPLYEFLAGKQQISQRALAKQLRSSRYLSTLSEWEDYLKEPVPENPLESNANVSIKQLADRRIWKAYQRVLHEGNAINDLSSSEALHELRKSCKKLRYLMEFFQNLYSDKQINSLIKNLKGLQEVLGDFQDYAVQEQNLQLFSEEMMKKNTPAKTLLAMGVLIQDLDTRKYKARNDFAAKFTTFKQATCNHAFKSLFTGNS